MRELFLDRAAARRKDGAYLNDRLADPATLLVPVWRNKHLVKNGRAVVATMAQAGALVDEGFELAWLGEVEGTACFAVDVSSPNDPLASSALAELGELQDLLFVAAMMSSADVSLLKYARGILHWHRQTAFCGRCGGKTRSREGGHSRECQSCGEKHFPRTDPAVMVLVTSGDRCLLARQKTFPSGMVSALAGFVEPGESVEECVLRETKEEVGLDVRNLRYFDSQGWPFPQSLMLGFFAEAVGDDIVVDEEELESARWYARSELEKPQGFFYPPPFSLAHHLIQVFLRKG